VSKKEYRNEGIREREREKRERERERQLTGERKCREKYCSGEACRDGWVGLTRMSLEG
jgi:hypothetical protein